MQDLDKKPIRIAGIHIAGPNSGKTAMTLLANNPLEQPIRVVEIFGRIGNYGRHLSDDRLIEIMTRNQPLCGIFVDVPLTLPPCMSCTRPLCPGVARCEDVAVNYMLALAEKLAPRRQRRHRPVNPQSQRLWDVYHTSMGSGPPHEPTYNPNIAPLITRAKTLQRRLKLSIPKLAINETNIPLALELLADGLGSDLSLAREYRSFSAGLERRHDWLDLLLAEGWLSRETSPERIDEIVSSVEIFHSFVAALIGCMTESQLSSQIPREYDASLGWVHLPSLQVDAAQMPPADESELSRPS
jgi:hypothetical protein